MGRAGAGNPRALADLLFSGPTRGPRAVAAFLARVAGGGTFVAFGVGKFTQHASEVASFEDYGLPAPDALVYVIGVVELVGGLLLVFGLLTRPAALVLAGDMVAAIILSGIALGEIISLTVAPAELLICLYLLWTGPGVLALDHRLRGPAP
jgi:putative oxidoreductase